MTRQLTFVQGNTREKLKFTLFNANDNKAIDLTGATVKLTVFKEDYSTVIFSGNCTIIDAVNGVCEYAPVSGDMDTVGTFLGELFITFPDSTELRIQDFSVKIVKKAPS